ncbi:MAG TPA: helix-hairpin-helix domain-containing protein, partial [Clostridia bacterium]|nr:helix-hairpin-helix domain-containing protein [Clostridia bacterium]
FMEFIEGTVEGILFRNDINGYTVAVVDDEYTVVGYMPLVCEGSMVRLAGQWCEHRQYGRQFNVSAYEIIPPRNEYELERYLGSGVIKGIGPATAETIVAHFGMDAFKALSDPKLLKTVPGIGETRAKLICASFAENEEMRDLIMFFQRYGLSVHKAVAIFKAYGHDCVNIARKAPYSIIERVDGIGFKTIDKMALDLGFALDDPYRLAAVARNVLYEATQEGHTYLPFPEFVKRTEKAAQVRLTESIIVSILESPGIIAPESPDRPVYLQWCFDAEDDVAYRLRCLANKHKRLPRIDIEQAVREFEREEQITLAAEQKKAVQMAVEHGVLVLTGGPGTGKTTTLKCI